MAGYSAVLPIRKDPNDGFALLQTIKEVASQNLKMVLYTEPGERIWDLNFGVGIKRYLFEQNLEITHQQLKQRIISQVSTYLPYIQILNIDVSTNDTNALSIEPSMSSNLLNIKISYLISGYQQPQLLQI